VSGSQKGDTKLLDNIYQAVYKFRRPPIDEFIYGKKYLGVPSKTIFPRIMDIIVAMDDPSVRQGFVVAGKGSGKSTFCSVMVARGLHDLSCFVDPSAFFGVLPGTFIACLNMSVSKEQAKNVMFNKLTALLNRAPCFHNQGVVTEKTRTFRKVEGHLEFPENVHALSGHSNYQVFFGYDVFCAVLDELAWLQDTKDHPVSEEVHQGVLSSAETRFPEYFKIFGISTPRSTDDFIMSRYKEIKLKGKPIPLVHLDGEASSVVENGS